jgi:putative sterol carrier protein
MAVFKDTETMYDVLGGLFNALLENESFMSAFRPANVTIKFIINDPEGIINITSDKVVCGELPDFKPDVVMYLSGDTCHNFWLKRVNLPLALAKRTIKAKGPVTKILKVLPLLKPAYEMYPGICARKGLPT